MSTHALTSSTHITYFISFYYKKDKIKWKSSGKRTSNELKKIPNQNASSIKKYQAEADFFSEITEIHGAWWNREAATKYDHVRVNMRYVMRTNSK